MYLPEACLFDLDGVLLDTEKLHSKAWSKSAAEYGITLSLDQLNSLRGKRRIECAKQIVNWSKNAISINTYLDTHQPISKELTSKAKAIPGAELLVKWCFDNNIPMALVTSSSSSSVNYKTASHDWINLIETRVYGDDNLLQKGKPAPEPYFLATKKLGISPENCWAIEDSISGVSSALGAGCKVWYLNNLLEDIYQESTTKSAQSIYQIKHLSEILSELMTIKKTNTIY